VIDAVKAIEKVREVFKDKLKTTREGATTGTGAN